ncbi:MAG TPA: DUF927 domain-containing protein [Magnetospirillum sp.]|nr:DUF927 domain-containing protein [Magnetospirillum sp.]
MTDMPPDDPFRPLDEAEATSAAEPHTDWRPIFPVPDEVRGNIPPHSLGKPAAFWVYRNRTGQRLCVICRFDLADGRKEFLPLTYCEHPDGRCEWRWKGLPKPRPLYGLDRLAERAAAPVIVCEGEKAANAAGMLFPDHIATTSPNGAKSAGKADWSPLAGRRVVIWPDHDEEGRAYAADVARLAIAAGAESVAVVTVPDAFPEKWDLADTLPEGWTEDGLRTLLMDAPPVETPPPAPTEIDAPTGFRMSKNGLWFVPDDPEKPAIHVSGWFKIEAETRNAHGDDWGVLIAWTDNDGREHQWAMPRQLLAGDGSEVRARLLAGGLMVNPSAKGRSLLNHYLLEARTDARARCVETTGWHGGAYVTPGKVYGNTGGERVILQTIGAVPDFDCLGTLEGWQKEVATYAVGNSRLALALSIAFVGPLLKLVGEDSHGFHFCGASSGGKTTALHVASSAVGVPIHSWRTTDNSAEGLARAANDGLLLLDELSQVDGRAADAMAYMLGNGQGKGRMRKDSTNKPVATWRLAFLSTGEVGLADKIGEAGKKAKAGQAVRLIEIPADAGAGHKLFDTLHGFSGGDALARHLRSATERHRGHAIRFLLERITADLPALVDALKAEKASWEAHHLPPGADGQVSRVSARFALAAAAGELATGIGLLPWPDGEASRAAAICFKAWLDRRGGIGSAETESGLRQVRAFIEAHGLSRFQPIGTGDYPEAETKTINRVGFRRKDDSGRWEYLVLPEAWTNEVCKGLDARATAKDLIARRLLVPGADAKSSRLERVRIPGYERVRVYCLTADILAEGGE